MLFVVLYIVHLHDFFIELLDLGLVLRGALELLLLREVDLFRSFLRYSAKRSFLRTHSCLKCIHTATDLLLKSQGNNIFQVHVC